MSTEAVTKQQAARAQTLSSASCAPTPRDREKWSSKGDFILSTVGLCVGLGNVWRFPYLCYENGGGVFLIPYFLTLVLAGIPVLLLELSVGQMKSVGGLSVWVFCPAFKGVGYAAVIMAFWLSVYYIVILAYATVYMLHSFTSGPLPWSHCDNEWNSNCCMKMRPAQCALPGNSTEKLTSIIKANLTNCTGCTSWSTPVEEFWEKKVLKVSSSINDTGNVDTHLALTLLFVWILCYFCIWKGVKWTGKVVYFTALFPYALLICLFVRGLTLKGSAEGIKFYLNPNVTKLFESKVWLDGATQIFFSYGLGLGTHMALGSYNNYHNNIHRDALIIGAVNSGTSIFSGFVVFSVLGFMAQQQNISVREVVKSGPGLVFLAYPSALAELPGAAVWSVLFFMMIIFIGLDSQFCTLEGFITAVIDEWPDKLRRHRKLLILGVCSFSYIIGISFTTQSGVYIFRLFDHYSASGMALLFLIFCECVAFSWCYGINRFLEDCQTMLGFKLVAWWKYCWLIFCPMVCLSVLVFSLFNYETLKYKGCKFPTWATVVGVCLALSSVIMIPTYFCVFVCRMWCRTNQPRSFKILRSIMRPPILPMVSDDGVDISHTRN